MEETETTHTLDLDAAFSWMKGWRHSSTWLYLVMLISSAVALFASFVLSADTLYIARHPNARLGCDISGVISCTQVAQSWQAELLHLGKLSIPNAFLGIAAESVFVTMAVIGLTKMTQPRWLAFCTWLGGAAALCYSLWLSSQSVFVIGALCPWCMTLLFSTLIQFMALSHATVTVQHLPHRGFLSGYYRPNLDLMVDILAVLALVAVVLIHDGPRLFA